MGRVWPLRRPRGSVSSAASWTCARCAVSVRRSDGVPLAQPDSWTESSEGTFCLVCSRAIAAEVALEALPTDHPPSESARIRRTAVIEFEVRRTPDAPNRIIARACRTSPAAVAAVRQQIDSAGADAPPAGSDA